MKYQSELSHYQNLRAFRKFRLRSPGTAYDELHESERAWLQALNELLRQLENQYYPLLKDKFQDFQARVADPLDWVTDFNLSCVITFYLQEDDPEYEDGDDNILMQIEEHYFEDGHEWGFGVTHINYAYQSIFPDEHHCYLYHKLHDHCGLNWRDLLRIGNLYVEIKIDEQSGFLPVKGYTCHT